MASGACIYFSGNKNRLSTVSKKNRPDTFVQPTIREIWSSWHLDIEEHETDQNSNSR